MILRSVLAPNVLWFYEITDFLRGLRLEQKWWVSSPLSLYLNSSELESLSVSEKRFSYNQCELTALALSGVAWCKRIQRTKTIQNERLRMASRENSTFYFFFSLIIYLQIHIITFIYIAHLHGRKVQNYIFKWIYI